MANDSEVLPSIENLPLKSFVSKKGNFSITLPELNDKLLWKFKEGEIRLNFFDLGYFVKTFDGEDFKVIVDRFNFDTMINLKAKMSEDLSRIDTTSKVAKTYFNLDNGKIGVQKYQLAEKRLYIILAVFGDKDDQKKFETKLDTFRVTKKTDSDSILKVILDRITASPLPQNPVAKGEKNDLADENLKGKVKQIIWYSQDLHYPVSGKKYFTKTQEFDQRGYLLKETVGGDFRTPHSVEVFGFIEGKRVSRYGFNLYNFSLFPLPEETVLNDEPNLYLKPIYDERYTTAFEKRYKEGNLSEKIWYDSADRIVYRRTYKYDGNQVTALGYDVNGNLIMKTVGNLNADKNYISEIRTDRGDSLPFTNFIQYELDKQRNWIKQIFILKIVIGDRESLEPQYAIHRTITYYK